MSNLAISTRYKRGKKGKRERKKEGRKKRKKERVSNNMACMSDKLINKTYLAKVTLLFIKKN